MDEFIKALREGTSYDWIANNGWSLSKDELVSIIKEYDYAIHTVLGKSGEQEAYNSVADELESKL